MRIRHTRSRGETPACNAPERNAWIIPGVIPRPHRRTGLGSRYHRKRPRRGDACDENVSTTYRYARARGDAAGKERPSLRMHVAGHGAWNTSMVKRRALHNVRIEPRRTMDATARRGTGSTYRNAEHSGDRRHSRTSYALLIVGIFAVADSRSGRSHEHEASPKVARTFPVCTHPKIDRIFRRISIAKVPLFDDDSKLTIGPRSRIATVIYRKNESMSRRSVSGAYYIVLWDRRNARSTSFRSNSLRSCFIVRNKSGKRKEQRLGRALFDVVTTTETDIVAIQCWKLVFRIKLKSQTIFYFKSGNYRNSEIRRIPK